MAGTRTGVQHHARHERHQLQPLQEIFSNLGVQDRRAIIGLGRAIEGASDPSGIEGVCADVIAHKRLRCHRRSLTVRFGRDAARLGRDAVRFGPEAMRFGRDFQASK